MCSFCFVKSFSDMKEMNHNIPFSCQTLRILFPLWFYAAVFWVLPNHGGSGLVLPQNLLAWSALALMAIWSVLSDKRSQVVFPPGTTSIITGAVLWSLPIIWSPVAAWQWNALPKVLAIWGLVSFWLLLLKSTSCYRLNRLWLLILTGATLLQVFYGMIQLHDMQNLTGGRPYGSFQQINVMASFLATGMLCALWLYTRSRHKGALLIPAAALILIPAMLVLIQSRTGYLGAIFGSAILLLVLRKKRRSAFLLLMTGTIAGLCLLWFGPKLFPNMIPALVEKEGSTLQRWNILRLTWQLIMNHPIVGNGYGSFEALYGQLAQQMPQGLENATIQYPHNEFLYTWMEGGIVAVAGLLAMITGILQRLWGKGGRRWAGLALMLPIAIHMNLEYPLYQSVTHGITLVMLLVITGPAAKVKGASKPKGKAVRAGVCVLASAVMVFMVTGVITEVQLTRVEQQGLMPLAREENITLINPFSQYDRLDFDRHVALLLKFNMTHDVALLNRYKTWAEGYLHVHNNPDVYNSLMMIDRALRLPSAQALCQKAKAMWPEDKRFMCS